MAQQGGLATKVGPGGKSAIDQVIDAYGGCPCECQGKG